MTQNIKQIIIAIVVIIVAFVGFRMFFPSQLDDQALSAENAAKETFAEGQIILSLLNQLESVTLDTAIFSNKIFVSLVSFEKPIEDQVAGRSNPFLPIGTEGSGLIIPKSTSTNLTR